MLACLPGEQHDLGLIAFGLALRSRGWRIVYLGSDAPIETIDDVSRRLQPSLVVLNAVTGESLNPVAGQLRELADHHRVALGGAAAASDLVRDDEVLLLTGDLVADATYLTRLALHPENGP